MDLVLPAIRPLMCSGELPHEQRKILGVNFRVPGYLPVGRTDSKPGGTLD